MTEQDLTALLELIQKYSPFDALDHSLLEMLAKDINLVNRNPGFTLFQNGDYDADEYFLINGTVKLVARDGRENAISAGQDSARFPIARLRPRMYTAIAATPIRYFVIAASVLDELQRSTRSDHKSDMMQEMHLKAGDDGDALLYEFEQELNTGRFVLPSLPEVAFRIRELIDDPEVSMAKLAQLVNTDAAIATKLVKVSNSVMYRGINHCDDTQAAISRLGLITTKQLVTSFAVLGLFHTNSNAFKEHMTKVWKQSVEVAAYSYVIAKQLPRFNEEEALLAGLIHNIGEIVVLTYAERFYDLSTDERRLDTAINTLSGKLGGMVLEKWDFNKELVTVARYANEERQEIEIAEDGSDFDYCDLVQVAKAFVVQNADPETAHDDLESITAFKKLAKRRLSPEHTGQIIEEAQEQIADLRRIFN